jgi:hypothetical protein
VTNLNFKADTVFNIEMVHKVVTHLMLFSNKFFKRIGFLLVVCVSLKIIVLSITVYPNV